MKSPVFCAAVDLGATSGRVIVGAWKSGRVELSEIHRFPNQFRSLGSHDYWDLPGLWNEIREGLAKAVVQFPKLASVGVDTWGVDYVLLDRNGRLVYPSHAYRDARTGPGLQRLAKNRRDHLRLYQQTGIPNLFYNTSLQLGETVASHPAVKDIADRCLFLPDYFNFLLSGKAANEVSIASTSQLLNAGQRSWSSEALAYFGIPEHWFRRPILADTVLGTVTGLAGMKNVRVVAVPGHDTAAAYAAMPSDPAGGDLYLSSGTWSLVGFESSSPLLSPESLECGVANERMGDGSFRPLKNVIGLWLLEQTLKELNARPASGRDWERLISAAIKEPAPQGLLDVSDPAFANPPSMVSAIDRHLRARHLRSPSTDAGYVRLICDSLGEGHAAAARKFERLSGKTFKRILMVGGGARNRLLCQATADAAGIPLVAFSIEGSALGNIASQLIALGAVPNLAEFRRQLGDQLEPTTYLPRSGRAQ